MPLRLRLVVLILPLLLASCAASTPGQIARMPGGSGGVPPPGFAGQAQATTPTPIPPWRFVVLGDTRTEGLTPPDITHQIVAHARAAQPAVVLAVGDLIKTLDTPDLVREQWRHWRDATAPLGVQHVLVTVGNHDVESGDWTEALMAEAFPELPANGPEGWRPLTYALDYGGVRFISLNSERFGAAHRLGDAQLAWLEAQLADNPNAHTIVFSHDPAFPVGPHVGSSLDAYPQERDRLWELLRAHGVTAYIAGHEHLFNRRLVDGVSHLIVGTSGSWPYAGYDGDYWHYAVGEVSASGITMTIYDADGQQRDSFALPLVDP